MPSPCFCWRAGGISGWRRGWPCPFSRARERREAHPPMTLAAGIFLALLAAVNFRVRRSWFYPPALFSVWWAVLLIVLWLSGDVFYPLSLNSLAIYTPVAMAFTVGGLLRSP